MGNRRFSVTTYVLVGISLVALYFVGKTVNPPPPAPPKEVAVAAVPKQTAPPPAVTPEKQKILDANAAQEAKNRAMEMQKIAEQGRHKPAAKADTFNPTQIETGADFWQKNDMGKTGEEKMAAKVAAANAKSKAAALVPKLQKATPLVPNP